MRLSFFPIVPVLLVGVFTAALNAQPTTQPEPGRGQRGQRGAGMPQNVEGAMKGMNRAMRQLRKQISDASRKDENLKLIGDMQRNVVIAKGMQLPDEYLENAKSDDDRAAIKAQYHGDLVTLIRDLLDLEQSVVDGKTDLAMQQLDAIQKLRESSHEKLGVKEDERDK